MKIRHYLRGLGIGIIVSTLLVGFAYRNNALTMTDDEVIERARELGMVEENRLLINNEKDNEAASDSTEAALDAVSDKTAEKEDLVPDAEETEKAVDTNIMISVESTPIPTEIVLPDFTNTVPKLEVTSEDLTSPDTEVSETKPEETKPEETKPEETKSEETKKEGTKGEKTESTDTKPEDTKTGADTKSKHKESYTVTISKGSGSDTVSRLLEKGGVITSAADFDKYLCGNGYDSRIVEGNHAIPAGATYKEIADIITTRN